MTKETIQYKNIIAGISVFMLFLAIPKLPYGYYILLRWVVTISALFSVWVAYDSEDKFWLFLMGGIAILFNPIIPVHFTKEIWVVIDIVVAILFLVSIFTIKPKRQLLKEKKVQNLEEERRKFRDNTFVKSWDRRESNEELAKEFGLEAEEVKRLKTTLSPKRLELRRKKKRERLITISFFALIIVLGIVLLMESRKQQGDPLQDWADEQMKKETEKEPELSELDKVLLGMTEPEEELGEFNKLLLGEE